MLQGKRGCSCIIFQRVKFFSEILSSFFVGHAGYGFFSFPEISPDFSFQTLFPLTLRRSFFSFQSFTRAPFATLAPYFKVVGSSTKVFIWVISHTSFQIRASFRFKGFPNLSLFLLALKLALYNQSFTLTIN